jgi:hypothetical protein
MILHYRLALLALLTACASVAVFYLAKYPFLWSLLLWTAAAFTAALWVRKSWLKVVLVNLAAALLALSGYEAYLWQREIRSDPTRLQGTYTTEYFMGDDLLGYGPAKAQTATSEKYYNDDLIYSVRYTIDETGLRISPATVKPELGCALFFGGSVTFGEGVEDDQAMPYQVGVLTDNRYRIYNFAFHGYGPHQMLAAFEGGRVDEIINCRPTHVIYQAIIPHVERAAGLTGWDRHGPRYVPLADGVRLAGRFDDEEVNPPWKLWLGRWLTYDTLFGKRRPAGPDELHLYAEIVGAVQAFVRRQYPAAEFHALIWDDRGLALHDRVLEVLQAGNLRLHRMTDILAAYREDKSRYELDIYDHHPTAATHAAIAGYIVQYILGYEGGNSSHQGGMPRNGAS